MKHKAIILLILIATCARGEMWFPEFETLSSADQRSWGMTIQRVMGGNPSIFVSLPPDTAPYCTAARIYIRNLDGRLVSEINASLTPQEDGSKSITVNLFDTIQGTADLIVYMRQKPDAPAIRNFGGFSFRLNNKKEIAEPAGGAYVAPAAGAPSAHP